MEIADLKCALEQYHTESFGWALACCGRNRAEAEDVLHASYLKILEGRARFDDRSSVKTWLFGVIRRTAAEERRRRFMQLRFTQSRAEQPPVQLEQPGVDTIDEAARSAELLTALASLAPRQREVLHLVFYHYLTIEDAAKVMHVSLGTARTHYERGKARLRNRLRDGWE
jgi:RNA polymerase sigma-70 factor (ECF subfamily)